MLVNTRYIKRRYINYFVMDIRIINQQSLDYTQNMIILSHYFRINFSRFQFQLAYKYYISSSSLLSSLFHCHANASLSFFKPSNIYFSGGCSVVYVQSIIVQCRFTNWPSVCLFCYFACNKKTREKEHISVGY